MIDKLPLLFLLCGICSLAKAEDYGAIGLVRYESPPWSPENTTLYLSHNRWDRYEYVYANCTKYKERVEIECQIRNTLYNTSCDILLSSGLSSLHDDIEVVSIHFFGFSERMVIIRWIETDAVNVKFARYDVLEMTNCTSVRLNFEMQMPRLDPFYMNEIIVYEDWYFDVMVSSVSACRDTWNCMFSLDARKRLRNDPVRFHFNFTNIVFDRLKDQRYFFLGKDLASNRHKLMHVSASYIVTELFEFEPNTQWIKSNKHKYYTIWYTTANSLVVHCKSFDYNGKLIINETIPFLYPIKLIKIEPINLGMFETNPAYIFIYANGTCSGDQCKYLYLSRIERGINQTFEFKVECVVEDPRKIVMKFYQFDIFLDLTYGCEQSETRGNETVSYFHVTDVSFSVSEIQVKVDPESLAPSIV